MRRELRPIRALPFPLLRRGGPGLLTLAALGLFAAACGPETEPPPPDAGPGPGCELVYLGSADREPEMAIKLLGPDGHAALVPEGASEPVPAPLILPPQGGRVLFAGVRATNLDPCGVKITGSVDDPETGQTRLDVRSVNLQPEPDGWGASLDADISSFSNVPLCPNQWSDADLFGSEFLLTVSLQDRAGRRASKSLRIEPQCAEPEFEAECRCICKAGYVLGEPCEAAP